MLGAVNHPCVSPILPLRSYRADRVKGASSWSQIGTEMKKNKIAANEMQFKFYPKSMLNTEKTPEWAGAGNRIKLHAEWVPALSCPGG